MAEESKDVETREEGKPVPSKGVVKPNTLDRLQSKIDELEKMLADLKIRSKAQLEIVKAKLQAARLKNIEILERVKQLKPVDYSMSLYEKLKARFSKEELPIVRAVFCVKFGEHCQYIRGFGKYNKSGYFYISEAELLDYSSGTAVVMEYLESAVINEDFLIYWYKA